MCFVIIIDMAEVINEELIKDPYTLVNSVELKVPKQGINAIEIDDYIKALEEMAQIPSLAFGPLSKKMMGREQALICAATFYSHLKDAYGASTVGEALEMLRERNVSSDVVGSWIMVELAINSNEFEAIKKGYPEFTKLLEKNRSKWEERLREANR